VRRIFDTTSAVLAHDTSAALAELRMPALVLGGSVDAFFPAEPVHQMRDQPAS